MKVLKFAVLLLVGFSSILTIASDVTFDLDRIKTEHGRVYHDILILDSDRHGLLFRHRKGIAKIEFSQLSMNLRMLYEPVGEEEPPEPAPDVELISVEEVIPLSQTAAYTLTAHSRVHLPINAFQAGQWSPCVSYRRNWPSHWPGYQPALRLAIPECRARVIDDFLITTGLVPRPCGVTTYRLPYNRADLLY
ncbi:MAG: hypothetical protein AAF357_07710 [Verrucomicrobiota bacterium]